MTTCRIAMTGGVCLLLLGGCRQAPGPGSEAALPAVLPPAGAIVPLDTLLARMEAELDTAILAGPDGGIERLYRAEEISNRLLEAQVPFARLEPDQYSVEARLRQIQSVADRIVSRIRGGGNRDTVMLEAAELRAVLHELRDGLVRGGGPAPAPIEQLLVRLDSARR